MRPGLHRSSSTRLQIRLGRNQGGYKACAAQALVLPPGPTLGSELAAAPYRWDQRLFGALLRMPALDAAGAPSFSLGSGAAAAAAAEVPAAENTVAALCEVRTARPGSGTARIVGGAALHSMSSGPAMRAALQHMHEGAQVMGGRCYAVGSLRALLACVEGLAQRLAPALVASFRALPCADAPQLAQLPDATVAACPLAPHLALSLAEADTMQLELWDP